MNELEVGDCLIVPMKPQHRSPSAAYTAVYVQLKKLGIIDNYTHVCTKDGCRVYRIR